MSTTITEYEAREARAIELIPQVESALAAVDGQVVYAVQLGADIWVVHAFQKKSTQGIKTPQREIDLIENRLKRLKELLR